MDLNKELNIDLKAFLHWWGQMLLTWLPDTLQQAIAGRSEDIVLSVEADQLHIDRLKNANLHRLASLDRNNLPAQYAQLLKQYPELEKNPFVLCLNKGQALCKMLVLPAAVKNNLNQAIRYELDKYTPFKAEQVYFSTQLQETAGEDKIQVQLIVVPRTVLDELCAELNAASIPLDQAVYQHQPLSDTAYNLLPAHLQRKKNRLTGWIAGIASLILLLLFSALFVLPVEIGEQQVDALKQQVKQLGHKAQVVQQQQLEIDDLMAQTQQLVHLKKTSPFMIDILNNLTRLLPDNTWLIHFKYQDGKVRLQGQSEAASNLIAILETSPLFENVRFISPLTQNKRTGLERFQISADVITPEETHEQK